MNVGGSFPPWPSLDKCSRTRYSGCMTKKNLALKMRNDKVAILADVDGEEQTASGFIIPPKTDKSITGTVAAVGPGKVNDKGEIVPIGLKKGDKVLISQYGNEEFDLGGTKYYIVSSDAILAVIE